MKNLNRWAKEKLRRARRNWLAISAVITAALTSLLLITSNLSNITSFLTDLGILPIIDRGIVDTIHFGKVKWVYVETTGSLNPTVVDRGYEERRNDFSSGFLDRSSFVEAAKYYEELIDEKKKSGLKDQRELSWLYVLLGGKRIAFDYVGAQESYQTAVALDPKSPLAILGLAAAMYNLGKFRKAQSLVSQVSSLIEKVASKYDKMIVLQYHSAIIFAVSRNFELALSELENVRKISIELKDISTQGQIDLQFVALYLFSGRLTEAYVQLTEIEQNCQGIHQPHHRAQCFQMLGVYHSLLNDIEKSFVANKRALEDFEAIDDIRNVISTRNNMVRGIRLEEGW